MSATIYVASGAVVRAGRILLVKRALGKSHGGKWVTPGGKLEGDEQHREALARELREECGLHVGVMDSDVCLFSHELSSTRSPNSICRVACILVRWLPRMGEVQLKLDEVDGFAWFSPSELETAQAAGWLGPADAANAQALAAVCQ